MYPDQFYRVFSRDKNKFGKMVAENFPPKLYRVLYRSPRIFETLSSIVHLFIFFRNRSNNGNAEDQRIRRGIP